MESGGTILAVGLACLDHISVCEQYPEEDSDERCLEQKTARGGNASNICTVLSQLDAPCEYFGTIAKSPITRVLLDDFKSNGISYKNCVFVPGVSCPTAHVILNRETGSRTCLGSVKNLPDVNFDQFQQSIDLGSGTYRWIHFEGRYNVPEIRKMLLYVRIHNETVESEDAHIITSVELEKKRTDLSDLLDCADYVFVGKDFARFCGYTTKEEAATCLSKKINLGATVICPWGSEGATAMVNTRHSTLLTIPAYTADRVVDSLGAGDTFNAATIYSLNNGCALEDAVDFGCKVAGTKVGMDGFHGLRECSSIRDHLNNAF